MSMATYFVQDCPTCGRRLQVRVSYLGKLVVCQHCRGQLEACDPESRPASVSDSGFALMARAEELLATADERKKRSRY
jgi:ssDNA-binding Zn-finger/Zn-ribbon topoisomerase 1